MREIKFRAWDKKNKKWLLGYEYESLGGFSLFGETVLMGEWAATLNEFLFNRNDHKFKDLAVMQYTGLKDKQGKEIYEGDVVRCRLYWNGENKEENFIVEYGKYPYKKTAGFFPFYGTLNAYEVTPMRVISNIYENPKLLTTK